MSMAGRVERRDSNFRSRGLSCAGWLYLPEGVSRPPVVIMGHGFAAEKTFRLPAFAERFTGAGIAAFVFDYRNFGDSEGAPRNLVNPYRHLQDWDAAISHVQKLPGVDGGRIALWGSSFGGGHVIVMAARRPEVAAIVSQVPFVDGVASLSLRSPGDIARAVIAGMRDVFRMVTFRAPWCVPVVAAPGTFAVMNTEESMPGYLALVPHDSEWRNEVPARVLLLVPWYSPMRYAKRVRCPALVVAAEYDSLIPVKVVVKTASRIEQCELHRLPCNHFQPYVGEFFEKNIAIETEFLVRRLKIKTG